MDVGSASGPLTSEFLKPATTRDSTGNVRHEERQLLRRLFSESLVSTTGRQTKERTADTAVVARSMEKERKRDRTRRKAPEEGQLQSKPSGVSFPGPGRVDKCAAANLDKCSAARASSKPPAPSPTCCSPDGISAPLLAVVDDDGGAEGAGGCNGVVSVAGGEADGDGDDEKTEEGEGPGRGSDTSSGARDGAIPLSFGAAVVVTASLLGGVGGACGGGWLE